MRTEYTNEDGEEVLRRAIAIDTLETRTNDVVRRTADELGISSEALEQAEREYFMEKRERAEVKEFAGHQRRGFLSHLGSYVIVNAFLFAIDGLSDGRVQWAFYPLLGWGIGIAFHALSVFNTHGEDFQKEFEEWRAARRASEQ
ncbi:MAG: 2TM domain-containing protein [Armatimonadota bacterium]|nr:2TM domain-containing protein [Armatimonadota bacterium]